MSRKHRHIDDDIEELLEIYIPFMMDLKMFQVFDEETGDPIGLPYSYNDSIKQIKDISGVNQDLLGKK